MGALERENSAKLYRTLFDGESEAAQYAGGDKVFAYHYDEAERHYNEIRKLVMPYATEKNKLSSWFERAIKTYEELYRNKDDEAGTISG